MAEQSKEQQVVFFYGPPERDSDTPALVFGVSEAAWEYMKDGHSHEFDLTKLGVPLKVILFGAPTRQDAMDMVMLGADMNGISITVKTDVDLHFDKPKE